MQNKKELQPNSKPVNIEAIKNLYKQALDARELIVIEGCYPIEVHPRENKRVTINCSKWVETFYLGNSFIIIIISLCFILICLSVWLAEFNNKKLNQILPNLLC